MNLRILDKIDESGEYIFGSGCLKEVRISFEKRIIWCVSVNTGFEEYVFRTIGKFLSHHLNIHQIDLVGENKMSEYLIRFV